MENFKKVMLAAAISLTAGTATAQDWNGAYGGAYALYDITASLSGGGLRLGYNLQKSDGVFSVELDGFRESNGDTEAFVNVRAGYLFSDKFLGFASMGRGRYNGSVDLYAGGVGVEYMMTDAVSLRADYELHNILGAPLGIGKRFFKLGASWNF